MVNLITKVMNAILIQLGNPAAFSLSSSLSPTVFLLFLVLILTSSNADALSSSSSTKTISFIDASGSPNQWPSALPVPENCQDELTARKSREAMAGQSPSALEGRCKVDFDAMGNGARFVHVDPPVLVIDDFLTPKQCTDVLQLTSIQPPPDAGRIIKLESRSYAEEGNKNRISTTWYVRYGCKAVAPLLNGISNLLPRVALEQIEELQLVRYAGSGQGFAWHEDALRPEYTTADAGGQRIATCLVYLDECDDGRTIFRDLLGSDNCRLAVSPKIGRALLFFPSATGRTRLGDAALISDSQKTFGEYHYDNTRADHRTSHAGEPPSGVGSKRQKHIAQLWIHSADHTPVVFGRGLNRHVEAKLG
mmetsp:Transcript_18451/g.26028  ORF Transcript_18451/g.26028 Transcript_18451/m.26028 type:complete len:364 (+) Transcript_18451:148-1239(+)